MAKINLSIEANDADDLQQTLWALGQMAAPVAEADDEITAVDEVEDDAQPQEAAAEPEKPRRGRPKKDAAPAEAPSSTSQPEPTPATAPVSAAASLTSLLDETADAAPVAQVDAAALRTAMQAHMDKHEDSSRTQALLAKHGGGAMSFKQIAEEHYPAVYAALTADMG